MKNFRTILFSIALTALSAVSCQEDDNTLYYNNRTMGNIVDGRFVSDKGNIFNVVEQTCDGKVDTMKRAIMVCDVLNTTEGREDEYDVRVSQLASVLTKNPVASADADEDIMVKDPIHIPEIWYSGGYLNMQIVIPIKHGSKVKHMINLVYSTNEDGAYTFEIRHNGFGDTFKENASGMTLGGAYVSFPITEIVGKDNAKFIIRWKWLEPTDDGYGWTKTEKEYKVEYEWKREGFEQVPLTFTPKSGSEII